MAVTTNPNTTSVFRSLGRAILVLLLVNLVAFLFRWLRLGLGEMEQLGFRNGAFAINGETAGLPLGTSGAYLLLFAVFLISMIGYYRRGMVSLKKPE